MGFGTLDSFWVQLFVPGGLLLGGYWLSGLFFHDPQAWLEAGLLASDRRVFTRLEVDRRLMATPAMVLEALEAAYTADYVVVGAGALIAAAHGAKAISRYWTIVLAAELACYAALPFLRSRPPRTLEPPGVIEQRAPRLRRLNISILDRASVQANTIPSGHVAGAVAAALAVMAVSATAGLAVTGVAVAITVSAIAGRYHYAVDCVLGVLCRRRRGVGALIVHEAAVEDRAQLVAFHHFAFEQPARDRLRADRACPCRMRRASLCASVMIIFTSSSIALRRVLAVGTALVAAAARRGSGCACPDRG